MSKTWQLAAAGLNLKSPYCSKIFFKFMPSFSLFWSTQPTHICPSAPYSSKSRKTKQISSENNVRDNYRECGSGQMDHWCHPFSSISFYLCESVFLCKKWKSFRGLSASLFLGQETLDASSKNWRRVETRFFLNCIILAKVKYLRSRENKTFVINDPLD